MRDETGEEVPLLMSKLAVPSPASDLVERQRLIKRLAAGAAQRATVLMAPAGWGKTALLADWIKRAGPGFPVTWLTVDVGDDEGRFWSYLGRALSVSPTGGDGTTAVARRDGVPIDRLLITLADGLSRRGEPVVLVVDDAQHLRDREVWDGLEFLLRRADGRLRLVVATREPWLLPLARWRLAGGLTEIGAGELSLTLAETQQMLARLGLDWPFEMVSSLHERTEGWPAGLRLEIMPDADGGPDGPAGASGFLREEILAKQSPDLMEALTTASIDDYLCGELVNVLTGKADGSSVLEEAERHSMFVVCVDDWPWTHRLHPMLGTLLRARLRSHYPQSIAELHRRSAGWHAEQGLPALALHHALRGRDGDLAIEVLCHNWPELIIHGDSPKADHRDTAPHEFGTDPMLALALAVDQLQAVDHAAAYRFLRIAERGHTAAHTRRPDRFQVVSDALHLALASARGDVSQVQSMADRVLMSVPIDEASRASVLILRGSAQLAAGDIVSALGTLGDAAGNAELSGLCCLKLAATGALASAQASCGQLSRAETTARRALALPTCAGQASGARQAHAHLALAIVRLQRGAAAEARSHVQLAAGACNAGSDPGLGVLIAHTYAQTLLDQADTGGARQALLEGRRILERLGSCPYPLDRWLAVAEADLLCWQGNSHAARTVLAPFDGDMSAEVAVTRARAELGAGHTRAVLHALAPLHDAEVTLSLRLEAGMLQAIAAHRVGDRSGAADAVERVLELAEPEGFRRVFAHAGQEGRRLLAGRLDNGTAHWPLVNSLVEQSPAGQGTPAHETVPGQSLSGRELVVLRYLQGSLSNPEIAGELCVSVNTVKTHVRSIYRKLDATSRRGAVKRAREISVL